MLLVVDEDDELELLSGERPRRPCRGMMPWREEVWWLRGKTLTAVLNGEPYNT